MADRRGLRLALEVAYLVALAAALAFTSLSAPAIVAVMLAGWALVVASEWAAARERPHFASGLPPRWYVPAVVLPAAQPLEQVLPAYPEPRLDEGATWIASAALREELLGEWPLLIEPEDTQEALPEEWIVPLPAVEPELVEPEPEPEPEPELEPEPEPVVVVVEPAPRVEIEVRLARYHVDPFAEPERRRFGRRGEVPALEVPARPSGVRPLPRNAVEEQA
jgi:hypothetical protein